MDRQLTILILEDDESDALLIQRELRTGLDFTARWVQDKAGFLKALGEGPVDLILSDYSLPGFNGLAALELARKHLGPVPVIMVSGVIGEDKAIETLKAGATDFVLKDRLSRLVMAAERALREARERAERRRAEEALRQAHDELEQRVRDRTSELSTIVGALQEEVRKRGVAEEELRRKSGQLRALTTELIMAEQRERRRLAQLLHDGLQQLLVGVKLRVEVLDGSDNSATGPLIGKIDGLLSEAIHFSRSLAAELSPPILREGGLVAGLEWLVRWMEEKQRLTVHFDVREPSLEIAEELVVFIFEATRELLFNVVKHSGVKEATVRAVHEGDELRVTTQDEGIGFDPSCIKLRRGVSVGGLGLFHIRERMDLLGGRVEIDCAVGRGSRITLVAPVPAQAQKPPISFPRPLSGDWGGDLPRAEEETREGNKIIRVVLVDDHIAMRQGLSGLLEKETDIEIVGEASDGESAVQLVRQIRPDVVLMDLSLPGMNGIEATRLIHDELPEVSIIGLSMFDATEREVALREAGAVAYLTKSGPPSTILSTIRDCAVP